jgi:hypothetical protein
MFTILPAEKEWRDAVNGILVVTADPRRPTEKKTRKEGHARRKLGVTIHFWQLEK